ncbi:talin-2-like isoform X4 [Physella acuta]|uniref:talin-2-like isoform X4 n=1 Tax=Physella acuta TaxID=109671 RepID=UPI0027DCC52E|nr:talin-2-like isoform X4 [Physella acuta]
MATLSLKISVVDQSVIKTMQFEPSTIVYDACRIIRERIPEANPGNPSEYGLFLADEDPKKGVWLEQGRSLEYYLLRNGDLLEYKRKHRILKVRTLDGVLKTLQVDDSHTVGSLMITICTRMGITNHEEYSLVRDLPDEEKEKTLTLKRDKSIAKDQKRLEEMKKKLHTDDELNWLDHSKTLREQDIDPNEVLLLRRKFFYSDQNVDARDPVQLNLLYVQSRDAILNGTHPVSMEEAIQFGGLQCQVQFGDHVESKHKPGFLDLKEFLPKEYVKIKGIEKKIFIEHKKFVGLTEVEAKVKYTQFCRSLKTYGITFFLVKEKMKGKNKLVPRLLGITKESVVRVDEKTKEILKTWPLTTVRRWAASPNSFTLDFGDYSDTYYSVQTTEGEQISQLIAGYIDIILRKKKAKDHLGIEGDDNSTMYEENVQAGQATIIQHNLGNVKHPSSGNVSMPGLLRDGYQGENKIAMGSLGRGQVSSQSNNARSGSSSRHGEPYEYGDVNGSSKTPSAFDLIDGGPTSGMQSGSSGQTIIQQELTQAQRAFILTISDGLGAIDSAQDNLNKKSDMPTLGDDPASKKWRANQLDLSRQKVGSQLSAMNAATAQLVTLTSGEQDDIDYTAVGAAVNQISSNVGDFSRDVKMLATLQEGDDSGLRLLDAARGLIGAFSDLLKAAEPGSTEPRQNLLTAAGRIGEASQDVINEVGEHVDDLDKIYQEALLALAKAVANATASLVLKAKTVANTADEPIQQDRVISSATQCALATSQLVACTKVVAPTIGHPACQEQLIEAAKLVAKSVEGIVESSQAACKDDHLLQDLGSAATAVTKALNDLLMHIKKAAHPAHAVEQHEEAVDTIINVTDRLFSSVGDAHEMVKQAKQLAQATSTLVSAIRGQAEDHSDSDTQRRLLAAAKQLADATAKLVEAAKGCASSPNDSNQQQMLRVAAEELRSATNSAASNALKKRLMTNLESSANQAAAAATQLINASNQAYKTNRNPSSNQQMITAAQGLDQQIPALVQALRAVQRQPDSATAQLALINAAQDFIQPASRLIGAANAAAPTVSDQAAALNLHNAVKFMSSAIAELRSSANKAQEACTSLEIDSALDQLGDLDQDLADIKQTAMAGRLTRLPGETAETCSTQLGTTSKTVGSSMAQLLTAAAQGNEDYVGIAARDTVNALKILVSSVRGVAATTEDKQIQQTIIDNARDVIHQSIKLLDEAKSAMNDPNNPDNQQKLSQVAKAVSSALNNCVNCLPGQRDIDNALRLITQNSQNLSNPRFPPTDRSYQEVQNDLNNVALNLNQSASDIVSSSRETTQHLAASSTRYSHHYEDFVHTGLTIAGLSKDLETQNQIVGGLKSVSMVSSKLLMAAKSVSADPNAPNSRNLLAQAARAVTESINHLFSICTMSAPGQKECDNALRQIQVIAGMLDNPNEPVSDLSYFDSLQAVMEKSQDLGNAMTGISNHAKKQDMNEFCNSVRNFANSVCGLTEASVQAAYLVGISDPASEPGRPGVVDQTQFARANQAIQMACQNLTNPASSQQQGSNTKAQVLSAATVVAKHTSSLCNSCRLASSKTANPVAKRHFVQSAKDVANSTASLVKAIKALDSDFTEENRQKCAEAARPLISAVDELTTFASSPEFASKSAKISMQARSAQEPITRAGKDMINGACGMLEAAKQLAVHPKDPAIYQIYSYHSKNISDAIKSLVSSIKDMAPGQHQCDNAIEHLNMVIRDLDQASLAAISQNLKPQDEKSLKAYQEQMINSAREILDRIDFIRQAAKEEPQNLGHLISTVSSYFEPLTRSAIGTASKTVNSKQQMNILDLTKTVAESALQFMYACKEGGGNPKATHAHHAIDSAADDMKDVLQDLLQTMEEAASQSGVVNSMIDTITKSIAKTDERQIDRMSIIESLSFVDHQTNMVRLAKQIARTAQDMIGKSTTNVGQLGVLANQLTRDFAALANDSLGATQASNNTEIGNRIRSTVQDLGKSCVELVQDAGNLQGNPTDQYSIKELSDHARSVQEKVSYVLAALQAGARGTQACINAASTVSGIIGDLDTTIMFASAGTLNDEGSESFADQRENILKTAKALVEDTKTLVAGAASNQEQLAAAAQCAVKTITRLADVVKLGAASLGSEQPEAQVLLINAVKDVASALSDLISATKNASGKSVNDPAMLALKESAKVMVTNVTSLLKTVKTVEDEAVRGTRALESTIEAIGQEIKAFDSSDDVIRKASAEDLIRYAKPITTATAKAVAAGNSGRQEDVISTANMGRKAIFDLLSVVKGAAATAETSEIKKRAINAGRTAAVTYKELLENVHLVVMKPTPEGKQTISVISRKVANAVTELVQSAEAIKAQINVCSFFVRKATSHTLEIRWSHWVAGSDWVDPDDPTVIAENELLTAASSIEAAAKKLAQLKPRQQAKKADEDLDFEEQILEAAKSIAAATAALVKSASAAQRELVAQGKVGSTYTRHAVDEDGQWSQGLISAAKMVAAATHSLCEAANAMVQGHASEERLIASAKEVAGSTAQLLMACKVKADPGSMAMQRLQSAGNAVKRATEALVRAAQQAKDYNDDESSLTVNKRMVGGIAQEIQAQEEILRKEKELIDARKRLMKIRQDRYKDRPPEDDD